MTSNGKTKRKDHGDWQVRIMHALDDLGISWQAACRLYGRMAGMAEPFPAVAAILTDEVGERMAEILSGQVCYDRFSRMGGNQTKEN